MAIGGFDTNSKIKAVFIYNFTKYIEWPSTYKKGSFKVAVVGETPLYNELSKMAQTKKVAGQSFEVKKYKSVTEIEKCHIVYLPKEKTESLPKLLSKVKQYSTLIVTEQTGLIDKGAGINFVIQNNKQKFELNKRNVEKQKLKVSSNLEALAFSVK